MKKRVLSLLMALALCFTMLPTAALAQQTGAADVYTTGEDTAVQGKRAAEAVRAAQALIDALPEGGLSSATEGVTLFIYTSTLRQGDASWL